VAPLAGVTAAAATLATGVAVGRPKVPAPFLPADRRVAGRDRQGAAHRAALLACGRASISSSPRRARPRCLPRPRRRRWPGR
jgi:hypothetical protein